MRIVVWGLVLVLGCALSGAAQQQEVVEEEEVVIQSAVTVGECTFLNNPSEFLVDKDAGYAWRSDSTIKARTLISNLNSADAGDVYGTVDPATIPRRNFIDNSIFSKMAVAKIQSAPLTTDTDFVRRVYLDLTGRIPSASDVDAFLANTSTSKRDALIDSLIGTPEFVDKWTMFLGDLYKNNANATNVNRSIEGRDAFYLYIKDSVNRNKPYDQMARELITAQGDTFVNGAANWVVGTTVPMGPAQDTYDGGAVQLASAFLGINAVDCLLCHDGPRHLDQVNLWGATQTRQNMWGLSAYFARARMARTVVTPQPLVLKYNVTDANAGNYNLNTTTGNRSPRQPINGVNTVQPRNPFVKPTGPVAPGSGIVGNETYRQAIARQITGDLQFSRATVNYIWEKFMVEAFVSPSNGFDPARLDASNPPPEGWTLQPTNPELLDQMAQWFQQNRYDLRALMALIVKSNAYQLSSSYAGSSWNISYVPYYARHFVRRLDAEEIHDAIAKATNIIPTYPLQQSANPLPDVQWAMQLPDTREPIRNGAVTQFLNSFGRGDRDTSFRRSDGSAIQALNLMNNAFVMTRIHQANAGSRVASVLAATQDPPTIIRSLFNYTLSRQPTATEIQLYTPLFQQQGVRVAAESVQWILLNKLEFIFNY